MGILGDNPNGQSFVVGFGSKYPQNPHHSASSCPNPPATCGWNEYNSHPTTNELTGALVGGCRWPDDKYNDQRSDYFSNEVTLDVSLMGEEDTFLAYPRSAIAAKRWRYT